ncbi:MAG: MFS transporter [Herbiconiux sp.]|uniref:MFS transporter n=1 Tax=Herbiconiux sp. TaxID=1871186 RepID=UPI0011F6B234|nr:MFS transporter [Herbiconiux sp.]TAJ49089.1 MAG: MFS transporter [Herbiconiux sp.]
MTSSLQEGAKNEVDTSSRARIRATVLATLGNVLEWYDFTVYGFLAVYIAANFFPGEDPIAALLSAFGVFAVGFIARPLGALVLGPLVDRKGRKSVMLLSMLMMAGGSLLVGIAPSYVTFGAFGAFVIIFGRLLQGFSAGGEFGSSAVFLVEWANPKRRGFFGSFHQVATYGGLLVGVVFVAALTAILGSEVMASWGWRIPFILGSALAIVVLILRRRVSETPVFSEIKEEEAEGGAPDAPTSTAKELGAVAGFFLTIGVVALWAVTSMVTINYMPTFTSNFAGIPAQEALWATCIGCLVAVVLIPLAGHLSDRFGRKPFIIGAAIGYIVLAYPMFWMIVEGRAFGFVVLAQVIFAVPTAAIAGTGSSTISELFATKRRGSLVSIGSAISVTVFGGFGALICTLLITTTGLPTSPAFYVIGVAVITLIAGIALPNLATRELRR